MHMSLALLSGLAVLAALVLGGGMLSADLAHPFWQGRASLTGGLGGAVVAALALWRASARPGLIRGMAVGAALALVAAVLVTWRAARHFIDSPEFEPLAGKLWFLGYHALAGLIVISVALGLAGMRRG